MFQVFKRHLYFVFAAYFRFFAARHLRRWRPEIIVVTGSAGKTTLLHLLEAQLGNKAHYSHHANSAYGIPFDILGLDQVERGRYQWLLLFLTTPYKALRTPYKQRLYVAEVDADRPHEARFLGNLLKPAYTLWVSSLHTHTAQFDIAVRQEKFKNVEEAIAYEYGNLLTVTTKSVIIDGDNPLMIKQLSRTIASTASINLSNLKKYKISKKETAFDFLGKKYVLPALLPRLTYYQVAMADTLMSKLGIVPDYNYRKLRMPPGRSNVLDGIKGTILIDSTYNNSNITSLTSVLDMMAEYDATSCWAVVGDMLEQGDDEKVEHEKLATYLNQTSFERLIIVGPRCREYMLPHLGERLKKRSKVVCFDAPADTLTYLMAEIKGGETIVFKGVRYMEGIIESLLLNKADASLLPRRGPIWDKRRAKWGLV